MKTGRKLSFGIMTSIDMREILVQEEMIEKILTTAEGTSVTNRPRFQTMSQPFFHLFLYSEDGYTRITVVENGDVAINPRRYFL